ncbi:MAG TPA: RNA polymerase sigma factor RpoD/SigA [Chitinophagales bacterium]|jgi:RNA polymerase primary sigma factor|nr:sigma-70 family RNA polymerase sigma factor [Chitinophagales bacterium]MBP6155193.1 sigma-70 family RNA polymerase sigma factor [Chitinophagales bacterium]HQV77463.1 RNA polymerase sigma factor RpoD/SigA [Chitinophagales bacterium]HQW78525.1 RNA polymerase sigma factor RpoD/SigA [Chitinophagales bacterium]HRB70135.1 RNA polymerase sigma factor RpoD/SigA [Chitinophagales bacterium]
MKQLKITTKITSRDSFSIDKYLSEISKLPMLSEEEEVETAKKIKQGDAAALDKLVNSNLRFVVSVAKQYQNQGLALNDLINEGNVGLIKAATKFDETKGFKFISYAVWWIRQSILQALIEQPRVVRLPMNKATIYNKIQRTIVEFEQNNQREPSNDELAELLEMKPDELATLRATLTFHLSIDTPIGEDDDTTSLDLMSDNSISTPDSLLIDESLHDELEHALHALSEREAEIVRYYFGINEFSQSYSLDEIGIKMHLTRERVRQVKDKAIRKMRRFAITKELKSYLN